MANSGSFLKRVPGGGRTVLAAVFILVAAIVVLRLHAAATPRGGRGGGPVPVSVTHVIRQDIDLFRQGLGTVQAFNSVALKVRVDGALVSVDFKEGQDVKQGDLVAQIDPRPYEAALHQAMAKKAQDEAQLANAKRDLARFADTAAKGFTSRQQLDTQTSLATTLEAQVQADEAAIESARINLSFCRITAPIEGRIGLRQVDIGSVVHAADLTGLATISQIHPISVIFTLPADDLPVITKAMKQGALKVVAFGHDDKQELAQGELLTIDSVIDQTTGTMRLKATFPNEQDALWPGLFISAHLMLGKDHDALTIPSASVQRGPDGYFVYVIKADNTAVIAPIEIVELPHDMVVVTKGLSGDEQVVINGQSRLQPGARVAIAMQSKSGGNDAVSP